MQSLSRLTVKVGLAISGVGDADSSATSVTDTGSEEEDSSAKTQTATSAKSAERATALIAKDGEREIRRRVGVVWEANSGYELALLKLLAPAIWRRGAMCQQPRDTKALVQRHSM